MAAETAGAAGPGRGGRMSRQCKRDAVLRLLRGENRETVSRARRGRGNADGFARRAFLAAGGATLTTWPTDGEAPGGDRPEARLGEMLLERELLKAEIATLEASRPFPDFPAMPSSSFGLRRAVPPVRKAITGAPATSTRRAGRRRRR